MAVILALCPATHRLLRNLDAPDKIWCDRQRVATRLDNGVASQHVPPSLTVPVWVNQLLKRFQRDVHNPRDPRHWTTAGDPTRIGLPVDRFVDG